MTTRQLELLVVAGREALQTAMRQWNYHATESRALDGHPVLGTTDEMECRIYNHALATLKRLGAAADELEDARIERPQAFAEARGSASLTWIAEPTRAGWWWWRSATDRPRPYRVIEGAWITSDSEHHWLEVSFNTERLTLSAFENRMGGGRWAGPIEEPPAWDEETTPNDPNSATPRERASDAGRETL